MSTAPPTRTAHQLPTHADPYLRPAFTRANRARRALWNLTWLLLFRPSPRPLHAWRAELLRLFGATLGPDCHIYPAARIWAPWNLMCSDHVAIADDAEVYNPRHHRDAIPRHHLAGCVSVRRHT